jgi:hypothetical protein
MRRPPKPTHIVTNYKKEMKNMERLSEIQYQNRVLLRKMLHIDLKNGKNGTTTKQNLAPAIKRNNSTLNKKDINA